MNVVPIVRGVEKSPPIVSAFLPIFEGEPSEEAEKPPADGMDPGSLAFLCANGL